MIGAEMAELAEFSEEDEPVEANFTEDLERPHGIGPDQLAEGRVPLK